MNADELERERTQAGHELARLRCQKATKLIQRDIVDMFYDGGLTAKEALEIQKVRPIGFLGKDILAIEKDVKAVIEDSKAYREQLAHEFRQAIEALPAIPEKTCGWCGVDVGTLDDYKIVDREPMCNACVSQYFPEGIDR
jgi:hypothetical protein